MASVKPVQAAVGVFLEHRKEGAVVLVAIIAQRSKEARAQIIVGKNKAAKVGNKRLDAGTHRDEIEVWAQVPELHFGESLFQRDVRVGAIGAAPHIDINDAVLARVHIVGNAECRRDLDRPIARPERRVAVEQLETQLQCFVGCELFRLAKEFPAHRIGRANA